MRGLTQFVQSIYNIGNGALLIALVHTPDSAQPVPVARAALVHGAHRGRQHVAVRRGAQQAASKPQREELTSSLQGRALQNHHRILIADVRRAENDSQASFLDSLQPGGLLLREARMPNWGGVL